MRRGRRILLIFGVAVAMPALAAPPGRYTITPDRVAAAMTAIGMPVASRQITLLADVTAATADPQLRLISMERWGEHRMMVRLECENQRECLPFMVSLNLGQLAGATPVPMPGAQPAPSSAPVRTSVGMPSVRLGSPAVLLLESDHVHIRIPVICLQNGSPGEKIRVTGKDHRQVYTAEVVDTGVLRGRL